jgi:hypothetical protein
MVVPVCWFRRWRVGPVHGVADVVWHRFTGAVLPALLDVLSKRGDVCRDRVIGHRGGLADRVDIDGLHAGNAAKYAVERSLLAGPLESDGLEDDSFDEGIVRRCVAVVVMMGVQLGLWLRYGVHGANALRHLISYTMW